MTASRTGDDLTYWAAEPSRLADKMGRFDDLIGEKIGDYYRHIDKTGQVALWRTVTAMYFALDSEGTWAKTPLLKSGGQQGEFVFGRANHFRSLTDHIIVLATETKPNFRPRPRNMDPESQAEVPVAEAICDYYQEQVVAPKASEALWTMLTQGEAWAWEIWDGDLGEEYGVRDVVDPTEPTVMAPDPITGQEVEIPNVIGKEPVFQGDVRVEILRPIDVVRDVTIEDHHDWVIVRCWKSKWDMVARFPAHRDEILSSKTRSQGPFEDQRTLWSHMPGNGFTDQIPVFYFYHRKSKALPTGRQAILINDAIVADGPMGDTGELPVYRMVDRVLPETGFGSSRLTDLCELQHGLDAALSTAFTNHRAAGVVRFWTSKGSGLTYQQLAEGAVSLESDGQPPLILNTQDVTQASMEFVQGLKQHMQEISGISSVMRGQADSKSASGAHLAMLYAASQEFNAGPKKAFVQCLKWLMTRLIRLMQTYATSERLIDLSGRENASNALVFSRANLRRISRVDVELENPMAQSAPGRIQLAEILTEKFPQVVDPQQFMGVLSTGRLEPVEKLPMSVRQHIASENDLLRKGMPVKIAVSDDHRCHIREHVTNVNDPELRRRAAMGDPEANNVLSVNYAHILEHIQAWDMTPPTLLIATGQNISPNAMLAAQAMAGAQKPGGPPGGGPNKGPEKKPERPGQVPANGPPVPGPNLPNNPATKEPVNVPGGGPRPGGMYG